jgi:hypothetical protein
LNGQIQNAIFQNQAASQYEYSIDGNINQKAGGNSSVGSNGSGTNQLISKSKINPVSGGIPISTILP